MKKKIHNKLLKTLLAGIMLSIGFNATAMDRDYQTTAEQEWQRELHLHEQEYWRSHVVMAAFHGNIKEMRRLIGIGIRDGFNLNARCIKGNPSQLSITDTTPLNAACENNELEMVKLLLQEGADIT
jgi:hypothetical protein